MTPPPPPPKQMVSVRNDTLMFVRYERTDLSLGRWVGWNTNKNVLSTFLLVKCCQLVR